MCDCRRRAGLKLIKVWDLVEASVVEFGLA